MEIEGKRIIVTGGANGIGRTLAGKLVEASASVGVFDRDTDALETLKNEINVEAVVCDITDAGEVEEKVNAVWDKLGGVDVLINNAGIIHNSLVVGFQDGGMNRHSVATWDNTITTNLSSVFYVTSNVVHKMVMNRTGGLVVNISSICAAGNLGQCAYSAAKAGVDALTVTWAKELAMFGIRVAGIAPGFTETEAVKHSMSDEARSSVIDRTPLKRMAKPEEIADGVIFIIENDFFNGRIMEIDGGLRI